MPTETGTEPMSLLRFLNTADPDVRPPYVAIALVTSHGNPNGYIEASREGDESEMTVRFYPSPEAVIVLELERGRDILPEGFDHVSTDDLARDATLTGWLQKFWENYKEHFERLHKLCADNGQLVDFDPDDIDVAYQVEMINPNRDGEVPPEQKVEVLIGERTAWVIFAQQPSGLYDDVKTELDLA